MLLDSEYKYLYFFEDSDYEEVSDFSDEEGEEEGEEEEEEIDFSRVDLYPRFCFGQ